MLEIVESIVLGNVRQWYVARGADKDLPVLFFLHGGPGCPQTGAQHKYNRKLEEHFIVVNWDQRGAGKSYSPDIDPSSMTVDQILSDAAELVYDLLKKFRKEKIYLMGHSMGAILGMKFIERFPELVYSYVGINQPVDRASEEERTFRFISEESRRRNDRKAMKALETMTPPVNGRFPSTDELVKQRKWLTKFGGVAFKENAMKFNISCIFSSHLSWAERARFMKGFAFSNRTLWDELNSTNLFKSVNEVKVPVYFVQGKHDKICHDTVSDYFNTLRAPHKELHLFENSGHFACFEEPDRFNDLMIRHILKEVKP